MKFLLGLVFAASTVNLLTWIALVPLWQNPDEQAHFGQVQNYAELGKIPQGGKTSKEIDLSEKIMGTNRNQFGSNKFTYHPEYNIQYSISKSGLYEDVLNNFPNSFRTEFVKRESTGNPPLYYWIGSIFYKFAYNNGLISRVFIVRTYSALIFLITLFVFFKICEIIFEKDKILQITFVSLLAFTPMLNHVSSAVMPDSMTNLLMSLVIYLCLRLINKQVGVKTTISIIAVVILGFITRQQFLISIPILFYPIFIYSIKHPKNIFKIILIGIISYIFLYFASFTMSVLAFIRGLSVPEIGIPNLSLIFSPSFKYFSAWTINHTYHEVLPWYWGVYRWLSLSLPHDVYRIINWLIVFSVLGLLLKFIYDFKNKKFIAANKNLVFMIYASLIYFVVLSMWDFFLFNKNKFSFGIQGRYFFPVIAAHFSLLLSGYWYITKLIFKKYASHAVLLIVFSMVVFNDFSLYFLAKSYYSMKSLIQFIIQASQYKPYIFKGNFLLMLILMSLILQLTFLFYLTKYIIKVKNESVKRNRI